MSALSCLVTGARGFVGSAVVRRLARDGIPVVGAVRDGTVADHCTRGPSLGDAADWSSLLAGCDAVVHAAARVHVMRDGAKDALAAYRAVNVAGTLRLARQAAEAGVKRFVFISSVKVNGEESRPGVPFTASDRPTPLDPYAVSKAEAEAGLIALAADTGMEFVIVRPPLVYGPGVKANFRTMMDWIARGVPLPLGALGHNRRSLVALDNLVDLIVTCLHHPAAANEVFLAGDGEDLSTADLLRRIALAMDARVRLLPVPVWLLMAGARAVRKEAMMRRLCGNLQVDISRNREVLGWAPPIGVDEALRLAASEFRR